MLEEGSLGRSVGNPASREIPSTAAVRPRRPCLSLNACRTRRGGATRRLSRCGPGCAVEPLVHTPETIQSARIGGIGVIDDAVFEHEGAHARPIARKVGASVPHMAANWSTGAGALCRAQRIAARG